MATFPGFCDFHKRWFTGSCDWCDRDEQIARDIPRITAATIAKILLLHIEHKHNITDVIAGPRYEAISIGDMQDLCWSLEHEEALR